MPNSRKYICKDASGEVAKVSDGESAQFTNKESEIVALIGLEGDVGLVDRFPARLYFVV